MSGPSDCYLSVYCIYLYSHILAVLSPDHRLSHRQYRWAQTHLASSSHSTVCTVSTQKLVRSYFQSGCAGVKWGDLWVKRLHRDGNDTQGAHNTLLRQEILAALHPTWIHLDMKQQSRLRGEKTSHLFEFKRCFNVIILCRVFPAYDGEIERKCWQMGSLKQVLKSGDDTDSWSCGSLTRFKSGSSAPELKRPGSVTHRKWLKWW